ncbi:hypothetical protein BTO06_01095 [Tenacibaculum sp. SZ-18]|uniref:hypothetical protein n=1 Tax=Tenacibaculum sp. SZ-18 TaxID=754423 RepID=UPI000C2D600D|nr:hypothetical protein [Tenacibaculum sp. SZ-18]AUC13830.1 hypothetical protein BTO06_01095 [Tenacibaculum sp. SZ-18]
MIKVKVLGKSYGLKFGYGALRNVCQHYGYNKVSGYDKLVKELKLDKMDDPSFEQLDFIGNLIISGIKSHTPDVQVNSDDVITSVLKSDIDISIVMREFSSSLPNNKVEPKKGGK